MTVERFPENPLITPNDVKPSREDFEVIGAFNPGVIRYEDETLLLMRVAERPRNSNPRIALAPVLNCHDGASEIEIREFDGADPGVDVSDPRAISAHGQVFLTSISHLRLARSKDGRRFTIDEKPAIAPDRPSEAFGIEDARITYLDGTYYVVYKSVSSTGITQSVARTDDFRTFTKLGMILPPENMDAMLFPARLGGKYAILHRPFPHFIGKANMWLAYSDNMLYWGDHTLLAGVLDGGWESGRIGGGAVPFMTERGWLTIYHGASEDNRYSLGAMLLDAEYPERVIARGIKPILEPEADYERFGFVPNVVFTCGAVVDGDVLTIYYGAADMVIAGVTMSVSEILASLA